MMSKPTVFSVFRPGLCAGKAAIVTGGGTGIGKAITLELLYLGCNVMIASRKLDRLAAGAEEIRSRIPEDSSARLEFMQCNIRKENEVQALIRATIDKFGRIDYLVNNGGGQFPSKLEDIPLKGWNAVVETNLTGTFLMCKEVYNQWMSKHGGSIVNIIVEMWKGFPYASHTGAARAGVDNMTKSLSLEWAHSGVRINCVAPVNVYSKTAAANYGEQANNLFEIQNPSIPLKRNGTTEEVSATVCYLLSPAAAFVSGVSLRVDGGRSLYSTPGTFQIPDHNNLPAYTWEKDLKEAAMSKAKL